jgi:hypothetical protein
MRSRHCPRVEASAACRAPAGVIPSIIGCGADLGRRTRGRDRSQEDGGDEDGGDEGGGDEGGGDRQGMRERNAVPFRVPRSRASLRVSHRTWSNSEARTHAPATARPVAGTTRATCQRKNFRVARIPKAGDIALRSRRGCDCGNACRHFKSKIIFDLFIQRTVLVALCSDVAIIVRLAWRCCTCAVSVCTANGRQGWVCR